jgi:hypothetical protein
MEIWSYSCNILDETSLLLARSSILFGFRAKETIFTGTQTQDSFRGVNFIPIIFLPIDFVRDAVQKLPSLGHEPRTLFGVLSFLKSLTGLRTQLCQVRVKLVNPFRVMTKHIYEACPEIKFRSRIPAAQVAWAEVSLRGDVSGAEKVTSNT